MKTCPICSAMTFEDMEMCFSCLHRFDDVPAAVKGKDSEELPDQVRRGAEAPVSLPLGASAAESSCGVASKAYRLELTLIPVDSQS